MSNAFGNVAGSGGGSANPVPEPTAVWLLMLAAATLVGVGRGTRSLSFLGRVLGADPKLVSATDSSRPWDAFTQLLG